MQISRLSAFRTACMAICCLALFILLQLNAGCGGDEEAAVGDTPHEPVTTVESSAAATGPASNASANIEGEIVKTMDSGGYTYILVQTSEEAVWAAGPIAEVKVGEKVVLPAGMQMRDFQSKTLNRTFDILYFVSSFGAQDAVNVDPHKEITRPDGGADVQPGQGGSGSGNTGAPISGTKTVLDRQAVGDIERAPGGHTVAEIYARKTDLAGQTVKVRGVVVKFSPAIMGTNWVHLQDGTGATGTSDLTVTTNATVRVGDLITIQGVLAVDKDFGAGYFYKVIVQKAELITD